MNDEYEVLESPSETLEQKSKYSPEHDKSGQNTPKCLFRNRVFEPWPNKYLKSILMEHCLSRIDPQLLPGPWDCPLPRCNEHFNTIRDVITHLEDCRHLKPTTRQYTCPCCHTDAQVPAASIGPGHKAMSKLTKTLGNIRGHLSPRSPSSSAVASPTAPFQFNASLFQVKDQTSFIPYAAENTNFNSQESGLYIEHNSNTLMGKLNTQLPLPESSFNDSCPSSTTTDSAYGTGSSSSFSPQGPPSATSTSQSTFSPWEVLRFELPCPDVPNVFPYVSNTQTNSDAQHFGGLPYQPTVSELPGHAIPQDITNMHPYGAEMEGMTHYPPLDNDANVDFTNMEELQGIVTNGLEEWTQHQSLFLDLPREIPQENYVNMGIVAAADPASDLVSPNSIDIHMTDALLAVEDTSHPTNVQALQCKYCQWEPDRMGNRTELELRQAVKKHENRNHYRPKYYQCQFCSQSFKNRPDNVKPHIERKHPEEFAMMYSNPPHDGSQRDRAPGRRSRRGARDASGPNEAETIAQQPDDI